MYYPVQAPHELQADDRRHRARVEDGGPEGYTTTTNNNNNNTNNNKHY